MIAFRHQKHAPHEQEFLTRASLLPEKQGEISTAAWLYTALLGNGRILACLDETGEIRQLFYPHIDVGPHLRSFFVGFQVTEEQVFGEISSTQPMSTVYWLAEEAWEHKLEYVEQTAVIKIHSHHATAGLHIERILVVHPEEDILISQITINNISQKPLHCQLVVYAGFDFDHRFTKNCCFFEKENDALTFFATDRYVQVIGGAPVNSFACAQYPNQLLNNIGQGQWSGNEYAIGQVSGAVRHEFGTITAHDSISACFYTCFAHSLDEVHTLSNFARSKECSLENCITWWMTRYELLKVPVEQRDAQQLYKQSLIVLQLLTDSQTGGIIAGPECDPFFSLCGGYGMCWPRDGAYNAHALDVAGEFKQARSFYNWALHTQEKTGGWSQRYDVNGRLSPTWGAQFDEAGTVVWSICRHIQLTNDLVYGREVFSQLLNACCYLQRLLDSETGLAPFTKDLWEERDSINTYASAATWGAFHEIALLATRLERIEDARYWHDAANQLKAAIEKHCWSVQTGYFLRGLNLSVSASFARENACDCSIQEVKVNGSMRHIQKQDATLDISLLGLSVPFEVFSPSDPRMQATAEAIAQHLTSPNGGIVRYQHDHYRGGNPWILCTLWLAWFDALAGNKTRARELYTWASEHRTSLYLLAEQIDRESGKPCWILPLGWSHAMFLLASAALKGAI